MLTLSLATPVRMLVLIGGGEFSFGETREVDELLLAQLPAENRTIAFLPTASGSGEYASHFGTYLKTLDENVNTLNVPVYRGRDVRRQRNLDAIASAGLIYLGGGVTNNLLEALRESPVDATLRQAAEKGVAVAAIGAAASSFGTWARDMRGSAPLAALGWLADTVVETGFDPGNDTNLRRLMSLPDVKLGIGIPAGTALLINGDGTTKVAGSGSVAVFRKS
jgi:cyanophycinase-like exopeptidase